MTTLPLKIGDSCEFSKTVSESDVYLFGGLTGDFSRMHFNEAYMEKTQYKTRIVQGLLTFAIAATASTIIQDKYESPMPSVNYGYDHLRFTAPVFFGDTLTAIYTVSSVDESNMKTFANLIVYNQHGKTVCVAKHILKFFELEN